MKMKFFDWELKTILIWKNVVLPYFEKEAWDNSEMAFWTSKKRVYIYFGIKVWTLQETFI